MAYKKYGVQIRAVNSGRIITNIIIDWRSHYLPSNIY